MLLSILLESLERNQRGSKGHKMQWIKIHVGNQAGSKQFSKKPWLAHCNWQLMVLIQAVCPTTNTCAKTNGGRKKTLKNVHKKMKNHSWSLQKMSKRKGDEGHSANKSVLSFSTGPVWLRLEPWCGGIPVQRVSSCLETFMDEVHRKERKESRT